MPVHFRRFSSLRPILSLTRAVARSIAAMSETPVSLAKRAAFISGQDDRDVVLFRLLRVQILRPEVFHTTYSASIIGVALVDLQDFRGGLWERLPLRAGPFSPHHFIPHEGDYISIQPPYRGLIPTDENHGNLVIEEYIVHRSRYDAKLKRAPIIALSFKRKKVKQYIGI